MDPNAQKAYEMTKMLMREPRKPSILESEGFWMFIFVMFIIIVSCVILNALKVIKEKQEERIYNKLCGEVGNVLRKYLPIDAIVYTADTQALTWQEKNGNGRILSYSSLGFERLPDKCEHIVCQWIRDNIVYDSRNYHFESMTYERDRYEESDSATIERDYTGNYKITRDPGRYVTTQITIGHALVHDGYNFEGHRVNTKPLKKW